MSDPVSPKELADAAQIFERLGAIVRALHDALRELGNEEGLNGVANEFSSGRDRLQHIARITEDSANIVLTNVEQTTPIQGKLAHAAELLGAEWKDATTTAMVPDALLPLVAKTSTFISDTHAGCDVTRAALTDIMMAQEFQDLTGQLVKKVALVLEKTEKNLLRLLIDVAPSGVISDVKKEEIMMGPRTPGSGGLEQTDVDALLADLGF